MKHSMQVRKRVANFFQVNSLVQWYDRRASLLLLFLEVAANTLRLRRYSFFERDKNINIVYFNIGSITFCALLDLKNKPTCDNVIYTNLYRCMC